MKSKILLTIVVTLMASFSAKGEQFTQQHAQLSQSFAKHETDNLNKLLSLTEKQYKKIYNYLNKDNKPNQNGGEMPKPGDRRPDFNGGGSMDRPPMMQNSQMPPMQHPSQMPNMNNQENRQSNDDINSQRAKREKFFKKILTQEQFKIWLDYDAKKMQKEFNEEYMMPR